MAQKKKTQLEVIHGELNKLSGSTDLFREVSSDNALESEAYDGLTSVVDTSLELESFQPTEDEAGKLAASRIALAVLNPDVLSETSKLDMSVANYQRHTDDGRLTFDAEATLEAFGSQDPSNLAARSYKYNLKATRQDEFSKAIFPMVIGTPGSAGVEVSVDVDYLYTPHAVTGGTKFDKTLLLKTYNDLNGPLNDDLIQLIPVSNAVNAAYFSKALTGTETDVKDSDGTTYKTAPLAFGKTIPLVAIGQSPATVKRGLPQDTTMLNSTVSISEIVIDVAGAGAIYNSSYLNGVTFSYTKQGTQEEIELNLVNNEFVIDFGKLIATDTANPAIVGLAGIAGTHYGVYKLAIHGTGNTEDKEITVFGSALELVELRTKAGAVETTSGLVAKAKALKLDGYKVNAHITNEDINELGLVLTDTTVKQIIAVKPMSPRAIQAPVEGMSAEDPKVNKLINVTYYDLALESVRALTNIATFLRNNFSTGNKVANVDGIGRWFIDPYYKEVAVDLTTTLDSQRSGKRDDDIRGALVLNIKQLVNNMITQSGYGLVKDNLGGTIDVVVATNSDIASFLPSAIDLGESKRVKIVSRRDKTGGLSGKVYVLFGNFDLKQGEVDPLCFGATAYVPTLVGTGTRTIGKSTTRVLVVQPQAQAVSHTYIMGVLNVSGLDSVTNDKITQNVSK